VSFAILIFFGVDDGVHQAGEPAVQVLAPQSGVTLGALDALGEDARLAQDAQVVGEGRLGHREARLLYDLRTAGLAASRHVPHGRQPTRLGQRGEYARQLEVLRRGLDHIIHHVFEDKPSCVKFDTCRTVRSVSNFYPCRTSEAWSCRRRLRRRQPAWR
jgi:hypothetical protein